MFSNISWSSYIAAVSVLLLIWYSVMVLKFYYPNLKKIFSGEKKIKLPVLKNKTKSKIEKPADLASCFSVSFDTLEDAKELTARIKAAAEESLAVNRSKTELENHLRMILEEYPYVKISALRFNINETIISQCSLYPQIIFTLNEADSLWEKAGE